ncbi:MAG: 23S rRNA (guanosine(2251)-2'-O)-methyltransferase RlmB [Planctomycetaceae bacterium]
MSERSGKRKSRRRQLRTSHQKNWLVGRYSVLETLRAGRWPVDELFASDELDSDSANEVLQLAADRGVSVETVSTTRMSQLCHTEHHQGLAARMGEFPYSTMADLLPESGSTRTAAASAAAGERSPLIVICDRIQDAFNFGAILRCCDAMQVASVVIGTTQQVSVTPQVARSSAGAVNYQHIIRVDDIVPAAQQIRDAGFRLVAATEKASAAACEADLSGDVALIVGSEAFGVSPPLLELCDLQVAIPMLGHVASLNAAVAAGILLYEIRSRQMRG